MFSASLTSNEDSFGTSAPSGPKDSVLLLEDNEIIARLLTTVLRNVGYRVVWCAQGREGLEQFMAEPRRFALVLSDCRLPDSDGREICHQMRSAVPDLPVLLTSGRIVNGGLAPLQPSREVQFLPKPYSPAEMVARVRAMLGGGVQAEQATFAGFV